MCGLTPAGFRPKTKKSRTPEPANKTTSLEALQSTKIIDLWEY
ncbi:MAG: hypothetical protein [Microvirus sp.]|nr:MAG: hypothetical protein [Microvirus sp.]